MLQCNPPVVAAREGSGGAQRRMGLGGGATPCVVGWAHMPRRVSWSARVAVGRALAIPILNTYVLYKIIIMQKHTSMG